MKKAGERIGEKQQQGCADKLVHFNASLFIWILRCDIPTGVTVK